VDAGELNLGNGFVNRCFRDPGADSRLGFSEEPLPK
jgi:hypothetical protein